MRKWHRLTNAVLLAVDALPIAVPIALAAFGSIAMFFLILGQFRPTFIWPLGLAAVGVSLFTVARYYPRDILNNKARFLCNSLVILGVLAWGGFNVLYTSQHVLVNRDPGLYSNAGIWLMNHNNLKIPTLHIFGTAPGVRLDNGSGFKTIPGGNQQYVYAQGSHLLPVFFGLVGRIVGLTKSLHLNVLFGMSALLGIYAFGRGLVRRAWWAAVATGAIAASMPFIDVSRDSYSEALAATFTFGGLALLWLALKCKKPSVWFLSGIVVGASTMTRIDGYLSVAEVLAFVSIMLVLAQKNDRAQVMKQSVALAGGMAITSTLGWLDVSHLSTPYYNDLHSQFMREIMAIIACVILGAITVWVSWQTRVLARVDKATRSWRAEAGAIVVIGVAAILATRPLWYSPLDSNGQRTYAELTTQWVTWYIGTTFAVLGLTGIAMATSRALRKQQLLLTAALLVVVGTALLYLPKPNIAPDQIWAARRLVPEILPGVAVFAALALDWLSEQYMNKVRWGYVFAGLVSIAIILSPLTTSRPLLRLRPFAELDGIDAMCAALPRDSAILWVGERPSQEIVQPTRDICGVPAQGYDIQGEESLSRSTMALLAKNARMHNKVPLIGVYNDGAAALPVYINSHLKPVSSILVQELEHTYTHAPEGITTTSISLELGRIQPDGSIQPLGQAQ